MSKYTPATFQPTVRPDWAGILSYLSDKEKGEILVALFKYPSVECDSAFWKETIKPELDLQYQAFIESCKAKSRGVRNRWGKISITNVEDMDKISIRYDIDTEREREREEESKSDNKEGVGEKEEKEREPQKPVKGAFVPPTLKEVLEYAREQSSFVGCGGFACTPEQAEEFWSYYESQEWRIGNETNTPIRDWKPKLRQWRVKAKQDSMKQAVKTIKQPTVLNLSARERQDLINKQKTEMLLKQLHAQEN